jgi:polyether ionophore transport system permease protein
MATVALRRRVLALHAPSGAFVLLMRRYLRDARTRLIGFTYAFAAVSYLQPVAYRHAYPTLAARLHFAHSFAHNKAVVLFYGKAYDLLTVGGYSAWRVGGTLTIFAAVFGFLAGVRALRAEEDSGRAEILLALPIHRRTTFSASMSAIAAGTAVLWLAAFGGFVVGGLPTDGSMYLALSIASVIPVFAGVGALVSQVASSKRIALELGGAMVGVFFLLRVIADTSSSAGWLRWLTPLGWAEELRPFTGAHPAVLLLPGLASAALLLASLRIASRRDVGSGLLPAHDATKRRLYLLSSSTAQALRGELGSLTAWVLGLGALGLVIGIVSKSVSSLGISTRIERALQKVGAGSVLTPKGYISFSFTFFVLAISLLAVSQIAAARHEESQGRLETLLSGPVSRARWLGGRLALGAGACAVAALAAALLTWVGAVSQGVPLGLAPMFEAAANCLPVALVFLGLAALAFGLIPRAGTAIGYGTVTALYLWQVLGPLLGVPHWLAKATPFAHVGLVPERAMELVPAGVMLGIAVVLGAAAMLAFNRRDLTGT